MEARERERLCAMTFAASAAGAQAELGGKGARGSCHPQSAAIGRRGREEEEEVRFLFSLLPPLHAPSFLLFSFASPLPVLVRYCCVPFLPVSCPSSDWPMATPTHPLPPSSFIFSPRLFNVLMSLSFFLLIYFFLPRHGFFYLRRRYTAGEFGPEVVECNRITLLAPLSIPLMRYLFRALYIYICIWIYIYIYHVCWSVGPPRYIAHITNHNRCHVLCI